MPPHLPPADAEVILPAQEAVPGEPRQITLYLRYPGGALANVAPSTGLLLSLHNWGGTAFRNAPQPDPAELDVVIIGVDYYQSGDQEGALVPYDASYFQAVDALRALHFVYQGLTDFDRARLYATGGSGGGHVSLMVNKLAPRTLACLVDCSGMASLTDNLAYGDDSAHYSRDPASPAYLSPAMSEIRDVGHPAHLELMARLGNSCQVVILHGEDDPVCLAPDKRRVAEAMAAAGLRVDAHFFTAADVDGELVENSGHQIGDRTALLRHFAGRYLQPGSTDLCRLAGPCDFDLRETLTYPVTGGAYEVSYAEGYPVLAFQAVSP